MELGPVIAAIFAIGLLASGLASTAVGSHAGAAVMSGLLTIRVPMIVRRLVTLVPAVVILAVGIDPTWALVLSQVLLSLGIPFALIPLMRLTANPEIMGDRADSVGLKVFGWAVSGFIVLLNITLLVLTFLNFSTAH
jgi:manganese transport protein